MDQSQLLSFLSLLFCIPPSSPGGFMSTEGVCADYSRDCERRSDLCFTKVELMHKSCPKTCNVCHAAAAAAMAPTSQLERSMRPSRKSSCRDIASDCDETSDLCDNPSFKKMMKKQCAKTCGFCSPSRASRPGDDLITISGLAGIAEGGESGRVKGTSSKAKGKGVDNLSISELVKLIRGAGTTDTTQQTTCADMAYDCPIKQGLCGNARYTQLMTKMCMRTCNLCQTSTSSSSTGTTTL